MYEYRDFVIVLQDNKPSYMTKKENFNQQITNARFIFDLTDFETLNEVVEYIDKYFYKD